MKIHPDALAYWYLRLNGFLTMVNFVLHPDFGSEQRTDVDVLAVRFPFRAELMINSMQDDPKLLISRDKPVVLIAEVKSGLCALNGPWTDEPSENMQRILRTIGVSQIDRETDIARDLYTNGTSMLPEAVISLACFGDRQSEEITARFPAVPQISWQDVADFVFDRFMAYSAQKVSHPQWDEDGLNLWNTAFDCKTPAELRQAIEF